MSDPDKPLHSTFYGSRLFLKFFFWVWLTLILTGITVAVYGYYYHFKPEQQQFFSMSREMLEENGHILVNAYEKLGAESAGYFRLPGSFWLYDTNLTMLFSGAPSKHGPPGPFPSEPPTSAVAPQSEWLTKENPDLRNHATQPFELIPVKKNANAIRSRGQKLREKFAKIFSENETAIKDYASRVIDRQSHDSELVAGETLIGSAVESDSGKLYALICHIPNRMPDHTQFLIFKVLENMPIFLLATGLLCFCLARYMVKPVIELRTASNNFAQGNFNTRITDKTLKRFDEIGDLAADFNHMAEKIEQMISSQRRLFSDISHELRSPLARLQVSLELLQEKTAETEQPMIKRIGREISRMNALIEELLQFSKLESFRIDGQSEKIMLQTLLTEICNDAGFEGKSRSLTINLRAPEQVTITGIPQLIERAIENILRNALKYSPEISEILVELRQNEDKAYICITDKGPGIPESEMKKVFSPFYCLSEDRNPQKGGIGLGLAIAERAIKLHHGEITLTNHPSGGLVATIILPASLQ